MTSIKFGNDPVCEFLYGISLHGGADEESGHSESPTGWFARFSIEESELESLRDNYADEITDAELTDVAALVGHWLIGQNDQGFVNIESFDNAEDLRARFDELDKHYAEWDIDA